MVIIASEEACSKHNLTPLARLVAYDVIGVDPTIMGIGPAYAIQNVLKKTKMTLDKIDLVEVCMCNWILEFSNLLFPLACKSIC